MKTELLLGFPLPLPRVQLQETTFLLRLQLGVGLQPARQLGGKAAVRQQNRVPVLRVLPAFLRGPPAVGLRSGRARPDGGNPEAGAEP